MEIVFPDIKNRQTKTIIVVAYIKGSKMEWLPVNQERLSVKLPVICPIFLAFFLLIY